MDVDYIGKSKGKGKSKSKSTTTWNIPWSWHAGSAGRAHDYSVTGYGVITFRRLRTYFYQIRAKGEFTTVNYTSFEEHAEEARVDF